jgi:hypothetical protein
MQMLVKGIEAWSEITARYTHAACCMLSKMGFACRSDLEPDNDLLNLTFNLWYDALQRNARLAAVLDSPGDKRKARRHGWSYEMEERQEENEEASRGVAQGLGFLK